jgi:hypothetical protein
MLVSLYIGNHAADALYVRLGWALTRLVQKGDFDRVTHCESILGGDCNSAVIGSSSLRDGGVRTKHDVKMDPANWLIADVPMWDAMRAAQWFADHDGEEYDERGALATVLPGHHSSIRWFCNEAVGASAGLLTPETFTPSTFAAVCFTFGRDVTAEFFSPKAP